MTTHSIHGQTLIRDLVEFIRSGTEMPDESKQKWMAALVALATAGSKEEASQRVVDILGLQFKRGASKRDAEINVFRVEIFKLAGQSKVQTFEFIADETGRDSTTIRDAYYSYCKNHPERFQLIKELAARQHEKRHEKSGGMVSEAYLALHLCLCQQDLS